MAAEATPPAVWHLVERADELLKYAQNRDPQAAYSQARVALDEAMALAAQLEDRAAAAALSAQIAKRFEDLDRLAGEGG